MQLARGVHERAREDLHEVRPGTSFDRDGLPRALRRDAFHLAEQHRLAGSSEPVEDQAVLVPAGREPTDQQPERAKPAPGV
jgi:hypothetical protein